MIPVIWLALDELTSYQEWAQSAPFLISTWILSFESIQSFESISTTLLECNNGKCNVQVFGVLARSKFIEGGACQHQKGGFVRDHSQQRVVSVTTDVGRQDAHNAGNLNQTKNEDTRHWQSKNEEIFKHLKVSRVPRRILHLMVGKPSFWCASYLWHPENPAIHAFPSSRERILTRCEI